MLNIHGELVPVGGGDVIPLERPVLIIGRRESCDICFKLANVSGIHCELAFKSGYWYIRDMNSSNGIKVNGTRVQQKMLHPGDEITIAKRKWTIQYDLPVDRLKHLEEEHEDLLSKSLLEKAGLEAPKRDKPKDARGKRPDPDEYFLEE